MSNITLRTFISANGGREAHAIIRPCVPGSFERQLDQVVQSLHSLTQGNLRPVMVRWFLSDAANWARFIPSGPYASSVVEQPPLNGFKVCAWAWLQQVDSLTADADGFVRAKHGPYTQLICSGACVPGASSDVATRTMLYALARKLNAEGASLRDNCLRTWLLVRDVDVNYAGVVSGRNQLFDSEDLTAKTHFIASTGIGGAHPDASVTVQLDSLSYLGISPAQVRYLKAPSHLNPTSDYGVAFERGTAVDFGDRRHVFISGTASINNRGQVMYPGQIEAQTRRMLENIDALLNEADCSFADVGHMLVYLRDIADAPVVERIFAQRFPDIPHIILLAPVCRPAWLIEVECMAFKSVNAPFPAF